MKRDKIVIGTRGSKLALWQAEWVRSELQRMNPGLEVKLNIIKTTGDMILDVPLAKVGGKGLFVKEIEEAILRGEADLAVHSMKDVPTDFPEGLHLTVICEREDPRDAFISQKSEVRSQKSAKQSLVNSHQSSVKTNNQCPMTSDQFSNSSFVSRHSLLYNLPHGATIGTSSLRRACQLLSIRPDLKITQLRGNLDTRLRKLDEGQFDAIVLAVAGVKRLGWANRITEILEPEVSLPAIGQGAIGIECRIDDEFINNVIKPLNHPETSICVRAERAFLKRLEGGCQVPIAGHARLEHRAQKTEHRKQINRRTNSLISESLASDFCLLVMDGLVGSVSGDRSVRGHIEGLPEEAETLGIMLAEDLLLRGAREILAEVYGR